MTNELEVRRKIEALRVELDSKQEHLSYLDRLLGASKWLTFLLYLAFALSLYVGDIWHLQTLLTSFMGGAFGMVFFSVIAVLLAYVLAGTKHAAYTHFSMFKTVKLVLLVAVFTGIMAEVFNSSGVQDIKARAITDSSKEYSSLVQSNTETGVNVSSTLAHSIAGAEQRLARCKVNLANGKEKHCRGDEAKVNGLKASQDAALSAQVAASTASQSERFRRMDALKHEAYNPVIKSLSAGLAIEIAAAIALMMLIFAAVFEAMHFYLSVMRRDTLNAINDLVDALGRAEADYYQLMGYEFGAEEKQVQPTSEPELDTDREPVPEKKRFKYQMAPVIGAGVGIGSDGLSAGLGGGAILTPKAELPVTDRKPNTLSKPPFGFAPQAKAKYPAQPIAGGTGTNNPVLGRLEQQHELPLAEPAPLQPETLSKPLAKGQEPNPKQPGDETLSKPLAKGQNGLYDEWVAAVNDGQCKPSVNPTWVWIQKRIAGCETGSRTHDRTRITKMQKALFGRAIADGHMVLNPKYTNGGKKYLWNTQKQTVGA